MTGDARPDRPGPSRSASSPARDDEAVLPEVSRDETEVGWGDDPGRRDDDWYRRERPPHHE